jgi:hypothetical protein
VTGAAQRRVEEDGALPFQGGREEGRDGVDHDRHVTGW